MHLPSLVVGLALLLPALASPLEGRFGGDSPPLPSDNSNSLYPAPEVTVKNGTLRGFYLPSFNEDVFFGVPFAAPPVGNLRLRHPIPYQSSWKGARDATVRTPSCPGYAGFDTGLVLSEGMQLNFLNFQMVNKYFRLFDCRCGSACRNNLWG
jgi:hypothetical protein